MTEMTMEAPANTPGSDIQDHAVSVDNAGEQSVPQTETPIHGNEAEVDELTRLRAENQELKLQKTAAADEIDRLRTLVSKLTNDHRSVSVELDRVKASLRDAQDDRDAYMRDRQEYAERYRNETSITMIMGTMLLTGDQSMLSVIQTFLDFSKRLGHDKPEVRDRLITVVSNAAAVATGKIAKQAVDEMEEVRRRNLMKAELGASQGNFMDFLASAIGIGRDPSGR